MKDIQIIIACHKKVEVPTDSLYLPLHVGASDKESIGFTRDDTNDNISNKNYAFSELTGYYWAWKNLDCKYLGLVHYRRYFALHKNSKNPLANVLKKDEVKPLLEKYKILLPKRREYYIEDLYSHYAHTFDKKHLDVTREILSEKYPDYIDTFDATMKQTGGYMFNMFIMSKELSDAYCAWLFDILFELEKRIGYDGLTDFEKRYPGRISERLFNVWINKNIKKEEIKELPYIYLGKVNWGKKITSFLQAKFFNRKYDKSF